MKFINIICFTYFTILLCGCHKEPITTPPTPIIPAKVQLLIGKTWQVKEVNELSNCSNTHYVRGATGNTGADYDPLRFTFNADGTGSHTDILGGSYPITWNFLTGDSSKIKITVIAATPVIYNWNLVEVFADRFIVTTPITVGANQILDVATYAPTTSVTVTPPALTRTQMLTQKQWIISEVYDHSSCSIKHYQLNGSGNTGANYGIMRFKFNADGTGTHTDAIGGSYTISWQFTSADERNLRITVNGSTPVIYNWNQVEIMPGVLYATTALGTNVLDATRWITIP